MLGGAGAALLVVVAPAGWLLVRRTYEACGLAIDGERQADDEPTDLRGDYTLREVVSTPAFLTIKQKPFFIIEGAA